MRLFPLLMIVLALAVGQRVFGLLQPANAADNPQLTSAEVANAVADAAAESPEKEDAPAEKPTDIEVGSLEGRELVDFSESELNLLQSLRERRQELRQQEAKIDQQQRVLTSMEQRLDKKSKSWRALKAVSMLLKLNCWRWVKNFVRTKTNKLPAL